MRFRFARKTCFFEGFDIARKSWALYNFCLSGLVGLGFRDMGIPQVGGVADPRATRGLQGFRIRIKLP